MGEEVAVLDLDDFLESDAPPPTLAVIQKEKGVKRDKAREIAQALIRQQELDAEAYAPSGEDHLNRIINEPILKSIHVLAEDNLKLLERMKDGDCYADDGITPHEARKMFRENTKLLLDMKSALVKPLAASGGTTSIHMDLGDIFNTALNAARDIACAPEIVQ